MILSIILVLFSSYFITSMFLDDSIKKNICFLFFIICIFAQIVLSFELLSLFSMISAKNFVFVNFVFFISSFLSLKIKKIQMLKLISIDEFKKIKRTLELDKVLKILSIFFILYLILQLFIVIFMPTNFGDALSYYFTRCTSWVQNANINHFITNDTRELIMPVNMDFLYTWLFLFIKKDIATAIFSYSSFLVIVFVLYNFLGELKFSIRRRLWAIFTFSSFAIIVVMVHTPCADLFIGALILTSTYLFYMFSKSEDKRLLYFSTLSYALALGTKTTAIIASLSILIIFIIMLLIYQNKNIKKYIFYSVIFLFINFAIFSAYNYVLNFIQFANPLSCNEQLLINKFKGGFKGYLTNLVKYFFLIFDCSGVQNIDLYNRFVEMLQQKVLALINETPSSYMSNFFTKNFEYNSLMLPTTVALGVLGIFAFVPACVITIFKFVKKRCCESNFIILFLLLSFIFNVLLFARVMQFTEYNVRYLVTFFVLAAPCLIYTYVKSNKNLYKLLLLSFMIFYLFGFPFSKIVPFISNYVNFKHQRMNVETPYIDYLSQHRDEKKLFDYFLQVSTSNPDIKIAFMPSIENDALFDIEKIKFYGIKLDKILAENIEEYNLEQYDYIIASVDFMDSTSVVRDDDLKPLVSKCEYKNYMGNTIENGKKEVPAKVICEIPFAYILDKNFVYIDELNLKLMRHVVLKNKR